MIVQVLVAQRQPVDALREHLTKLVLDQQRRPPVDETGRHPLQQTDLAIGLTQQQRPAVGRYLPGCETGLYPARKMRCKREDFLITLCHKRGRPFRSHNSSRQRSYDTEKTAFPVIFLLPDSPLQQSACEICRLNASTADVTACLTRLCLQLQFGMPLIIKQCIHFRRFRIHQSLSLRILQPLAHVSAMVSHSSGLKRPASSPVVAK